MSTSLRDPDLPRRVRTWDKVPALRLDLRFVRGKDSTAFRVTDPKSLQFVELYELECLVAQAIDGTRSINDLTAFARAYNGTIRREQVELLVLQLANLGMLEDTDDHPSGTPTVDEFDALRNEIMLDLQPHQAIGWTETASTTRRAPLFEPRATTVPPADNDDAEESTGLSDGLDGVTNLAGADVFAELERKADEGIAAHPQPKPAEPAQDETPATETPQTPPSPPAAENDEVWKRSVASAPPTRQYRRPTPAEAPTLPPARAYVR